MTKTASVLPIREKSNRVEWIQIKNTLISWHMWLQHKRLYGKGAGKKIRIFHGLLPNPPSNTVGDYSGPPLAHGDPAPLGPKECKLKGEELVSYQFICMCWSKSQSISRVLMLMPRLFECNWLISEQTGNIRQYFHFLQTLQHWIENFPHSRGMRFWAGRLATQSTQLVQNKQKKKRNYSRSSTGLGGCSWIHQNCLKITTNLKKWLERIVRNNALSFAGQG